jgi:hypothetical protein
MRLCEGFRRGMLLEWLPRNEWVLEDRLRSFAQKGALRMTGWGGAHRDSRAWTYEERRETQDPPLENLGWGTQAKFEHSSNVEIADNPLQVTTSTL